MWRLLYVFSFVLAIPSEAAPLCGPREVTIFSCLANTKTISICASKNQTGDSDTHYRFGTKRRVELDFPGTNKPKIQYFKSFYSYGPGFYSYLAFDTGEFKYYTYSNYGDDAFSTSGSRMAGAFEEAGVIVFKDKKPVSHVKCTAIQNELTEGKIKEYGFPSDDDQQFVNAWGNLMNSNGELH